LDLTITIDKIHYSCSYDPTVTKKENAKKLFLEFCNMTENCFKINENEKIIDLIKKK
jgi:hypothetical protein